MSFGWSLSICLRVDIGASWIASFSKSLKKKRAAVEGEKSKGRN